MLKVPRDADDVAELLGYKFGTGRVIPAATLGTTDQMTPNRAAAQVGVRASRPLVRHHPQIE